jgi:UDP-N-acetylglucosamine--N-acetylmuramyl-(pentapeptide) pyrophosphoryl-undecaprenol N-acetylglucosamine transferase
VNQTISRTIIFAGGGTAGHVEPAIAVARAWNAKHPLDHCLFLGTPTGLENTLVPSAGFELCNIDKVVMPRKLGPEIFSLPTRLFHSVNSARRVVTNADLLVGFGGYLSASAYIAAAFARVPLVVHEANVKVGWANRLGAIFTKNLAVARPIASGSFSHATLTGLPLRADVRSAYLASSSDWDRARSRAREELGWRNDQPTLLILGGSLGSTFINAQIEAALPSLMKKGINILHSVGSINELPQNFKNYRALPYITNMATAYLAADVVLARSGAVTCAEVGALARMAIFVPLPIGNGEQARNAEQLVSDGRAILVRQDEFSARWLVDNIEGAIDRSRRLSEPVSNQDVDAAERIVALMENVLQRSSR